MYQRPPKEFLYSAYKIITKHSDGQKVVEGIATGFILVIGTKVPWIITNRHVIDLNYNQPTSKYKDFHLVAMDLIGRLPDDSTYNISINPDTDFYYHDDENNDVVMISPEIIKADRPIYWHFGLNHLATNEIFKEIVPFDMICFSGFPRTHDKLMERPILRCGTIASDPNFDYSWNKDNHGKIVAYEGFSTEGASGSPVFAPQRGLKSLSESRDGYLIGINAGHIPEAYGHSGISFFYKSTVLLEIIEKQNLKFIVE